LTGNSAKLKEQVVLRRREQLSRRVAGTAPILQQAAVIPYRILNGNVQVLLITSRDMGRWIVPKGNVNSRSTPVEVAEREAYEEAGVRGTIANSDPLGFYTYFKRLESGERRAAKVEVYLLWVKQQLQKWPERGSRKLSWVSVKEAVRLIEEPGVVPLLHRLMKLEKALSD
jgi:8-oxo-dGTP pyrophosphatase MutT (NUDIX family)